MLDLCISSEDYSGDKVHIVNSLTLYKVTCTLWLMHSCTTLCCVGILIQLYYSKYYFLFLKT